MAKNKRKNCVRRGGKTYWKQIDQRRMFLANVWFLKKVCNQPLAFRIKFGWAIMKGVSPIDEGGKVPGIF